MFFSFLAMGDVISSHLDEGKREIITGEWGITCATGSLPGYFGCHEIGTFYLKKNRFIMVEHVACYNTLFFNVLVFAFCIAWKKSLRFNATQRHTKLQVDFNPPH